jgi:DNA-binding transcriptional MerR regulator
MSKTAEAFRTISEVAGELDVPKHVLRFWEGRFPQIRPMKRGGGRRYYRPEDLALLRGICHLLHGEGYTIKGVQKILREQGVEQVKRIGVEIRTQTKNGEAPAKRGRRAKAPAPVLVHTAPASAPASPASAKAALASAPRDGRAQITAAIAELEVCRSILLGRAIETSARRRPGKVRRAART